MKKRLTIALLLFAVGAYLVSQLADSRLTPEQILRKEYAREAPVFRVGSVLHAEELTEGQLIFYRNGNGNLVCAYLEKTALAYRLVGSSGEISPEARGNMPANMLYTQLDKDIWIDWGVVTNDAIHSILINGEEAAVVEVDSLRICYLLGIGETSPASSAYQFVGANAA